MTKETVWRNAFVGIFALWILTMVVLIPTQLEIQQRVNATMTALDEAGCYDALEAAYNTRIPRGFNASNFRIGNASYNYTAIDSP